MVELKTLAEQDVLFVDPHRVVALQCGHEEGTTLVLLEQFPNPIAVVGKVRDVHAALFPESSR